ncbi:hypothetical protein [Nostoc sp. FACHB-110]|uniref:hypothetical protein n=1 Tax=Nostoc sp. FACHB-110 TaxID=2692834 RepID=UPI001689A3A7|nr:hypothetical protein [Nostoc sp. FACHB-110]MBD2439763.1 hypothetical protein [Nostoc sp. FACHB-110]
MSTIRQHQATTKAIARRTHCDRNSFDLQQMSYLSCLHTNGVIQKSIKCFKAVGGLSLLLLPNLLLIKTIDKSLNNSTMLELESDRL